VNVTGKIDTSGAEHILLFGGDFYSTLSWNKYYLSPINSRESVFYPVHPGIPFLGPLMAYGQYTGPQDTAGLYVQDQIKPPMTCSSWRGRAINISAGGDFLPFSKHFFGSPMRG